MDLGRIWVNDLSQTFRSTLPASIPDDWSSPTSIPENLLKTWSWIWVDLLVYSLCVYLNKLVSNNKCSFSSGSVCELAAHEDCCYLPKTLLSCLSSSTNCWMCLPCINATCTPGVHGDRQLACFHYQIHSDAGKWWENSSVMSLKTAPPPLGNGNVCRWRKPSTAVVFLLILSPLSSPKSQDANGSSDLTR